MVRDLYPAMTKNLILASESPRRRKLLADLGVAFQVKPAQVEELKEDCEPETLPEKNALLKAAYVAEQFPDSFVLGADTGVFDGRNMLGKPASAADALKMLLSLSGRSHQVISGVALICRAENISLSWSVSSCVTFAPFSAAAAAAYIEKVNVMDKAGAYAIQEHSGMLGARWEGELENIIGLPLVKLKEMLKKYSLKTE